MLTLEEARGYYAEADTIHDFDHVTRVYHTALHLAKAEGADLEIVQAAALLHDSRSAAPGSEERKGHHIHSAQFAGEVLAQRGWSAERIAAVQHCIRAHRFRGDGEVPATLEAQVVFDADKLDVIGAIGVARVVGYAAIAGTPVYAPPSAQFLASGHKEPGEPHSAYHEYLFKLRKISARLFTATAKHMAVDRDAYIRQYFERLEAEINGEL